MRELFNTAICYVFISNNLLAPNKRYMHKYYELKGNLYYVTNNGLVSQKTNGKSDIKLEYFLNLKPIKIGVDKFNKKLNAYWLKDNTEWSFGGDRFIAVKVNEVPYKDRNVHKRVRHVFREWLGGNGNLEITDEYYIVQHQGKLFNAMYNANGHAWQLYDFKDLDKFIKWTPYKNVKLVYSLTRQKYI